VDKSNAQNLFVFCPSRVKAYICLSNKTETSSAGEQLVRDTLTSDTKKVESKELSFLG
jgi:hypothetical protein